MALIKSPRLLVRSVRGTDVQAWLALWHGYCAELGGEVSEATTEGVWQRILAPCLLACNTRCEAVGFANYVLHPRTWTLQPVCYLEDLFVAPEMRGHGVGLILIQGPVLLGKQHDWRHVYWHTRKNNHAARNLYDRLATRTDFVRYDIQL
jgi:GNAT superfamily N-acetyltransferase